MMGALQGVSGKEPAEIFGKPNKAASEFIPGFEGSSTMMVGDRIDRLACKKASYWILKSQILELFFRQQQNRKSDKNVKSGF